MGGNIMKIEIESKWRKFNRNDSIKVLAISKEGVLYQTPSGKIKGIGRAYFLMLYKPLPLITQDERVILRNIKGYTWLARDENGRIFMYGAKPSKFTSHWVERTNHHMSNFNYSHLFDFIKWSDDEPWNIYDLLC